MSKDMIEKLSKAAFSELIATYGSKPHHWPADKRAAMQNYMAQNETPELSREAALDALLDARMDTPPPALIGRLIGTMNDVLTKKPDSGAPPLRWMQFGLMMAACLVAGVFSAPLIIEFIGVETDPLNNLRIADAFLLY